MSAGTAVHSTVKVLADHLQKVVARTSETEFWTEVWTVIESLPLYATGENWCFEIRPLEEAERPNPSNKLFALPAAGFADRWESITFAQTALEGMAINETPEEFCGTLLAARIEIVKSKMFCVAHHIFWAAAGPPDSEYARAVEQWLEVIGAQRICYADDEYYELIQEPAGIFNQGSPKWLSYWLQFRYDTFLKPVQITPRLRGDAFDPELQPQDVDRSIVLAAASFAWLDYSLIAELDATRSAQLTAAAGLALFLALESSREDDEPEPDPTTWGRLGGLERHKQTRALKGWALAEATRMTAPDRQISRELASRLPERFVDASEDPARLIYDAIRAHRAEQKARRRK